MVCLDTSILIDFLKGNSKAIKVIQKYEEQGHTIAVATPTIIEIVRGLKSKYSTPRERTLVYDFIESINSLDLDKNSAVVAGKVEMELADAGMKMDLTDIMIGSIALMNQEVLLTKNIKHFSRIKGLEVETY